MWGGEAGLEGAKEDKAEKREVQKQRRFDKKVKGILPKLFTFFYYKNYECCNLLCLYKVMSLCNRQNVCV